ncbi:WG repeat-containing protein [Stenotrophomonas sp. SY1]|uniref:WG repeat-containing protein n=1 Tax=Stenotrophomonas sp. SY1 TaxID=477235 RepID=UPI001E4E246B|nr:WG repeat-containing protein [Stenotrophomonas sp. SY1]MCD9086532.1 WG repeat-containing protein [Stenotrophomonas sp. SY1]
MAALLSLALLPGAASAGDACHRLDTADFAALNGCAQTTPGMLKISAAALARLDYDGNGLAALMAGGQHYYVRRDGTHLAVISYDNGPDYFADGLTRARIDGRIGYFNVLLQPAFPERFSWGFPFQDGIAEVCNGCHEGEPDAGGHTAIVGGTRFRIDQYGKHLPDPR